MTKLEKLREDLAKADVTLANARKRKNMLIDRIKKEEQRALQNILDNKGLSLEDVRGLLTDIPPKAAPGNGDRDNLNRGDLS